VTPQTAEAVRAHNAALDAELRALAADVPAEALGRDPGGDEWTVAQVLAHLGEFPRFFADDLGRWLDDPATPVGRTVEHPARLAAVSEAQRADLATLRADMNAAFDALEAVLDRLDDDHLRAQTQNVKYGPEPLTTYLDRYVLGHKAGHVDQLRGTLAAVR
jgi:hypothetical protein